MVSQAGRGMGYTGSLTSAKGGRYTATQGTIKAAERQQKKAAEKP